MTTTTLQNSGSPVRQLAAESTPRHAQKLIAHWHIVDGKLSCVWNLE